MPPRWSPSCACSSASIAPRPAEIRAAIARAARQRSAAGRRHRAALGAAGGDRPQAGLSRDGAPPAAAPALALGSTLHGEASRERPPDPGAAPHGSASPTTTTICSPGCCGRRRRRRACSSCAASASSRRIPRATRSSCPGSRIRCASEFPEAYAQAKRVEDAILAAGGAVVNPVDQLSNSIKSVASARLRAAGVPMPRVAPLSEPRTLPEGFAFPVIAREDRRHGGPMRLCRDEQELANVRWNELHEPVVVEYRDVRSQDGRFRKWRYVVAGEGGAPRHLVISRRWVVKAQRRVRTQAAIDEELAYTSSREDPNREILVRAAKALGLDVVAFDYARTRDGELVVFEPNPFATLWACLQRGRPLRLPAALRRAALRDALRLLARARGPAARRRQGAARARRLIVGGRSMLRTGLSAGAPLSALWSPPSRGPPRRSFRMPRPSLRRSASPRTRSPRSSREASSTPRSRRARSARSWRPSPSWCRPRPATS